MLKGINLAFGAPLNQYMPLKTSSLLLNIVPFMELNKNHLVHCFRKFIGSLNSAKRSNFLPITIQLLKQTSSSNANVFGLKLNFSAYLNLFHDKDRTELFQKTL